MRCYGAKKRKGSVRNNAVKLYEVHKCELCGRLFAAPPGSTREICGPCERGEMEADCCVCASCGSILSDTAALPLAVPQECAECKADKVLDGGIETTPRGLDTGFCVDCGAPLPYRRPYYGGQLHYCDACAFRRTMVGKGGII